MPRKSTFNDLFNSASGSTKFKQRYDTLGEFVAERLPNYEFKKIFPHQERWFEAIRNNAYSLILTPRNHAKTETMAILIPLYFMCLDHNIRITYVREKAEKAEEIVDQIKKIIHANPELGITITAPDRVNKFNIERTMNFPNATFLGTGIESGETGGRSDIMIFDDIETEDNAKTENDVAKHISRYEKVFYPMGNNDCKYIFIGTKKMDKDIYYHLERNKLFENNVMIDKMVNPYMPKITIEKTPEGENKYNFDDDIENFWLLWPQVRNWDFVIQRFVGMTSRNFMMEFQQECPPPEECPFKEEWLQYYTPDQLPSNLKIYLGLDPAVVATSNRNSYLAMCAIGVDESLKPPRFYLLDTFKRRIAPTEGYRKTLEMYEKWMPHKIYVENNAYQGAIVSHLTDFYKIPNAIGTQSRDKKEDRILKLTDLFQRMIVYIREDMIDFLQEYRNFKYQKGANKELDLLDSFHIAIREEMGRYGFLGAPVDFSQIKVSQSSNYVSPKVYRHIENAVRRTTSPSRFSKLGMR